MHASVKIRQPLLTQTNNYATSVDGNVNALGGRLMHRKGHHVFVIGGGICGTL